MLTLICKINKRLQCQIDESFTDCTATQVKSRRHTEKDASSRFFVQQKSAEVVILLQICHRHVSASHYFISEIPEFGLPKFRNFGMYKRPEIPEFRNLEIPELQSLPMTPVLCLCSMHALVTSRVDCCC